jgi:hypothetical protein
MFLERLILDIFRYFLAILVIRGPSYDSKFIVGYFSLGLASCSWALGPGTCANNKEKYPTIN